MLSTLSRVPSFKMKFSGVTILQGVEFSIFPIDFEWALQQCSATALPVMLQTVSKCRSVFMYCVLFEHCFIIELFGLMTASLK